MTPRTPQLRYDEVHRILIRHGFKKIDQTGSHVKYKNKNRIVIVPVHKGKDIGRGLVRKILKSADIDIKEI